MRNTSVTIAATLLGASLIGTLPARSADIHVAADIRPIHGLISMVTDGITSPQLIMSGRSGPHAQALRPSEARTIAKADVIFWIGPALTPALDKAMRQLGENARVVTLSDIEGTVLLPRRASADFGSHDHGHDHGDDHGDGHGDADDNHHDDDHDKADHGDEGHDNAHEEARHDDHAHDDHADDDHGHDGEKHEEDAHDTEHADAHGHDHDGIHDPHLWLSPANARVWLLEIAEQLAQADPDNGARYRKNASAARDRIAALDRQITEILHPLRGRSLVTFHDAFQYFERDYDLTIEGAVTLSDDAAPGVSHMTAFRDRIAQDDIACALLERDNSAAVNSILADFPYLATTVVDPLGYDAPLGRDQYPATLKQMAMAIAECADP